MKEDADRAPPPTNENARDRGVSGASFLRNSQFVIGVAFSGYRSANLRFAPAINLSASPSDQPATRVACQSPALPSNSTSDSHRLSDSSVGSSDQSPACAFNPPSDPTFRPTFDSRLRIQPSGSAFRPDLRLVAACRSSSLPSDRPPACAFGRSSGSAFLSDFQLAPSANLPALPSNLTSDSHRLLHPLAFAFEPIFELAPPVNLPAVPSSQLPACAFRQPSSSAFEPACDLRRLPVPGSAFCADLQLAPSIDLPAHRRADLQLAPSIRSSAPPSGLPAACAACQPSSPAFRPNLRLSSNVLFSGWFVRLQLAPSTNLAQPSGRSFDLRLRSCPQAPPFDQPATCAACQSLACLSTSLQLAPSFRSSGSAFLLILPACAFRSTLQPPPSNFNFRLTARHQLRRTLGACPPVHASANQRISVDIVFPCSTCSAMLLYCESAGIQPCNCIQFAINVGVTCSSFSAGGRSSPMCVPC